MANVMYFRFISFFHYEYMFIETQIVLFITEDTEWHRERNLNTLYAFHISCDKTCISTILSHASFPSGASVHTR